MAAQANFKDGRASPLAFSEQPSEIEGEPWTWVDSNKGTSPFSEGSGCRRNLLPKAEGSANTTGYFDENSPKPESVPYDDTSQAFLTAFKPRYEDQSKEFASLNLIGTDYQTLQVEVPPRDSARPVQDVKGLTFAVKDLFYLRGRRNSLCNRAYLSFGSESKDTATIIQRMLDAGAVLLGITKLSSMIGREEPVDAVDFQAPFNPRGDGYQSPAGSSSGSAAAVAAYHWLDFSIGTDTTGSGRRPSLVCGVFQFRPSHDDVHLDGFIKTFAPWDTPCLFVRDITLVKHVVSHWYKTPNPVLHGLLSKPPTIIYPLDYFPVKNKDQMNLIELFCRDLEEYLQTPIENVSIATLWKRYTPPEADSKSIREYLVDAFVNANFYEYSRFMQDFSTKYFEEHQKAPYVTPFVKWKWDLGKEVDLDKHTDAQRRLAVYKRWFLDIVMRQDVNEAFLIMPISNVEVGYRDAAPQPVTRPDGFDPLILSPILGAPDIVVPIGEVPYFSRVSKREEFLPVAINIVGCPGSDQYLLDTIHRFLKAKNRPTEVKTGSRMF